MLFERGVAGFTTYKREKRDWLQQSLVYKNQLERSNHDDVDYHFDTQGGVSHS